MVRRVPARPGAAALTAVGAALLLSSVAPGFAAQRSTSWRLRIPFAFLAPTPSTESEGEVGKQVGAGISGCRAYAAAAVAAAAFAGASLAQMRRRAKSPERAAAASADISAAGSREHENWPPEVLVDVAIFVACQAFFRLTDCSNSATCAIPLVLPAARVFFVGFNLLLLGSQAYLSRRARELGGEQAMQDAEYMEKRGKKFAVKAVVLYGVHACFGLMAPLVCSCLITAYGLPFFRHRDQSFWAKYGRSR